MSAALKLARRAIAAAVGFGAVYLLGSFTQAHFDISAWTDDARVLTAIFGAFGAGFGCFLLEVAA